VAVRVVALLMIGCLACGGASPAVDDVKLERGGVFGRSEGFRPVAFGVEVKGEGRPVILIPGLGCPGDVWDDTVAHLIERKHETHVLTLSGFAGRPAIREPLSAAVRRDLTRYIRSRKLDHPIIIGHSMGGFIAFWIASYHPELTGPIVIVDAGPALSGDMEEAKQLRSRWKSVSEEEFSALTKLSYWSMSRTKPKRMGPMVDKVAASDRRAFADAIYELVTTDLTAEVKNIKAPVLILAADGGFKERIRGQVETIPNHEMIVLPKTGHFLMYDDPERYFAELDRFIDDN
jgi:pimeloyl-ACP methyl ester carboxylesterase